MQHSETLALSALSLWGVPYSTNALSRRVGLSIAQLLGGRRHERLPAYVSGLPAATLEERCAMAEGWVARGFRAIKFAAAMSDDGIVREMAALREAVGPEVDLMVDLH